MMLENKFNEVAAMSKPEPGELLRTIVSTSGTFMQDYADDPVALEQKLLTRVRGLLERGAEASEADSGGNTLLMRATRFGFSGIVRELISAGASLDDKNAKGEGFSAMMMAVSHGYVDIVRQLVEAGADTNLVSGFGTTMANQGTDEEKAAIEKILEDAPEIHQRAVAEKARLAGHRRSAYQHDLLRTHTTKLTIRPAPAGRRK